MRAGASAEGIRAKLKKSGRTLRVTVPILDGSEEATMRTGAAAAGSQRSQRPDQQPQQQQRQQRPPASGFPPFSFPATVAAANVASSTPSANPARTEPPSLHLAALDFGPGCDACGVEGPAGSRRVVATKAIKRGSIVIFEAPTAAVKAGEPVASQALVRAFAAREGSGVGAGRAGREESGASRTSSPGSSSARDFDGGEWANEGDGSASTSFGGGGCGGGVELDEAAAGGNVPEEWVLVHLLLQSRALGGRPPQEWAREYVQAQVATDGSAAEAGSVSPVLGGMVGADGGGRDGGGGERGRCSGVDAVVARDCASSDAEVAAAVAAEVGCGLTGEDVSAVHRAVCANAFALEATCTHLHYGAGFFRAAAYMNHSCDPSCLSLRLGGNMAVFAARDVAAGEELTHSYLPSHHLLLPRAARQPLLFFDCSCLRCARSLAADPVLPAAPRGLEHGGASPVGGTALGRAALEVRTAAVAGAGAGQQDVLDAFASGVLGAQRTRLAGSAGGGGGVGPSPGTARVLLSDEWEIDSGMLETLESLDPQAAIELLEPVLDAHWRAALEAGGGGGEGNGNDGGNGGGDGVYDGNEHVNIHRQSDDTSGMACRSGARGLTPGVSPPDAVIAAVAARVWRNAVGSLRKRAAQEGRGVAAAAEQVS